MKYTSKTLDEYAKYRDEEEYLDTELKRLDTNERIFGVVLLIALIYVLYAAVSRSEASYNRELTVRWYEIVICNLLFLVFVWTKVKLHLLCACKAYSKNVVEQVAAPDGQ